MQRPDITCRVNSALSVDSFNQRPVRQAHRAHRAEIIFFADAIRILVGYFNLPSLSFRNHYQCEPEIALCLVLFRLSAPNRLKEDMSLF
jgi:hypothetical protein